MIVAKVTQAGASSAYLSSVHLGLGELENVTRLGSFTLAQLCRFSLISRARAGGRVAHLASLRTWDLGFVGGFCNKAR